ncbi:hypothetical protein NXS19_004365 [Fusarium pseudograminearum]|nr:hypothetical protein NXS19_004365 [Fusarium pseudograminearum]
MTALHWAIRNALLEILHLLLDLEARLGPDARVGHGSLIREAAETGNKAVLDALLERNISVESRDTLVSPRPLTRAVQGRNTMAVELLLMCNALVDTPDDALRWPNLLEALQNGDEAITRLLLEHTDTIPTCPGIWSSLLHAVVCGHWICAQLFLQKYVANTSMSDGDPTTPPPSPQKAVLDLLLSIRDTHKADGHAKDLTGTFNVDGSVVKLLIEKGAVPEMRRDYGDTILVLAVKKQRFEMVKAMLASGADVECIYEGGRNALSYACETGNEDITRLLLQSNSNVDVTDRQLSPCWFADRSRQGIRRLLLDAAANDEAREAMLQIWEELDASNNSCLNYCRQ